MLKVITKDEAVRCVLEKTNVFSLPAETVPLGDALGRVLAEDIVAGEDVPPFDRTTVDGYAVFAADTFGAGESMPCELTVVGDVRMGEAPAFGLKRGKCARIATGGMLPEGADAAVMVEHTDDADGLCLVYRSVAPGENITKRGDDVQTGQTVLTKGTLLHERQIGVLAALGVYRVPVFQKPRVAVISTGDELVSGDPKNGQIRDVNSFLLYAAARSLGCDVLAYGALPDDRGMIRDAVLDCAQKADLVLLSGGSSAGTKDMTVDILEELGDVWFHGIAMKPGKPTIFGTVNGVPVFGLPGHPLASFFVFRLVAAECLRAWLSLPAPKPVATGRLGVNIPSNHGREEYLCVKIDPSGAVLPVHTKSGVISLLSEADGFVRIGRDSEGINKQTELEIYGF